MSRASVCAVSRQLYSPRICRYLSSQRKHFARDLRTCRYSWLLIIPAESLERSLIKPKTAKGTCGVWLFLPEHQGSGVAAGLLDQVESDLRDLNCRAMTLDTTKPLQRAIRFYERNGFALPEKAPHSSAWNFSHIANNSENTTNGQPKRGHVRVGTLS